MAKWKHRDILGPKFQGEQDRRWREDKKGGNCIDHPAGGRYTMRLPTILAGVVAWLASEAAATTLTYKLMAHEKACFFADTKQENEKISFYFAVRRPRPRSPLTS